MKKIFISLLFVLSAVVISSCGGEEYSCSTGGICTSTGDSWEACCTSDDCYYKTGSKKFNCDGTDCDAAATELSEYCFGSACTDETLLNVVEELQEELAE